MALSLVGCSLVLGIDVHYGQVVLLAGIDADAVHQISGDHHVFHLETQAGGIIDLAVEPLRRTSARHPP